MTIEELLAAAEVIKNETGISKNTHIRVGAILENMINFFANNIAPVTEDLIKEAIANSTSGIRKGMSVFWDLNLGPIPEGFVLSNGNGGNKINGVTILDLRDRFILGYNPAKEAMPYEAGDGVENSGKVGNTGGSNSKILKIDQLPAHSFKIMTSQTGDNTNAKDKKDGTFEWSSVHMNGNQDYDAKVKSGVEADCGKTNTIGKGDPIDIRPLYVVVCIITKVSDDIDGGGSGGGIESIVAGENVTVDSTNPKNPIINVPITNGSDGRGITSIARTSGDGSAGTTDTYTITFTDNSTTTFTVVNGANGTNGTTTETIGYALSDQTSDITTGVKLTDRMPYAFTLTDVRGSLQTAASGGTFTVNIKKNGVSIFSTKLTFDSGEASTATASVPFVLSSNTFAADDIIEFSVDGVGSVTAGKGLIVKLIGNK